MASLHVKKGDRVKVISGKDKGVVGEIIAVYPEAERVTAAAAASEGGAVAVDGRMVDRPVLLRAQALLARRS